MNNWLGPKLRAEIKDHFQKKYSHSLSDNEIKTIATNLVSLVETIGQYKSKNYLSKGADHENN